MLALMFTDILAVFVIGLGIICILTLIKLREIMRYTTHVHKDDNVSMGIVIDTNTGKVMRTFDYSRNGSQWRDIAGEYRDKLNRDHKRKR